MLKILFSLVPVISIQRDRISVVVIISYNCLPFLLKILFIYSWEREREREAETQEEGEAGSPWGN